jgi:hypothetical protein
MIIAFNLLFVIALTFVLLHNFASGAKSRLRHSMNMDLLEDEDEENLKLHRAFKKRAGFNHHMQANFDLDEDEEEENVSKRPQSSGRNHATV